MELTYIDLVTIVSVFHCVAMMEAMKENLIIRAEQTHSWLIQLCVLAPLQTCINTKHIPVLKKSEPTQNPIYRLSDGADTSQTSVVFSGIYKLFWSFSHLLPSVSEYLLGVGKLIPAAAPSLHGSPQERERRARPGPSEAGARPRAARADLLSTAELSCSTCAAPSDKRRTKREEKPVCVEDKAHTHLQAGHT